ncbi:MAG: hypothetical protein KatS3mg103_1164 [Phycisphaerales bacterium]|nr:MAG: hypothetical protein KatS3mg103_1164 [Phycisphaerales bacterium]
MVGLTKLHRCTMVAAGMAMGLQAQAWGQVIDFELTPGSMMPSDNLQLDRTAPYVISGIGITFGFDSDADGLTDTDAVFERRGTDGTDGFFSTTAPSTFDAERPGSLHSLDTYFLRQPTPIGAVPGTFVIEFSTAVQGISGQIWDIDASDSDPSIYEQWRVTALDAFGNILATQLSPQGLQPSQTGSLDSLAWVFAFSGVGAISRVEIDSIGTQDRPGLGLDNFAITPIPAPTSLAVLGLAGQAWTRRRQRA